MSAERTRVLRNEPGGISWIDWPTSAAAGPPRYTRREWRAWGVACWWWTHPADPHTSVHINVSRALLLLVTGALPAAWAAPRVAGRTSAFLRKRRGLCAACGYDLRATPGRCPECGAAAAAAVAAPGDQPG